MKGELPHRRPVRKAAFGPKGARGRPKFESVLRTLIPIHIRVQTVKVCALSAAAKVQKKRHPLVPKPTSGAPIGDPAHVYLKPKGSDFGDRLQANLLERRIWALRLGLSALHKCQDSTGGWRH